MPGTSVLEPAASTGECNDAQASHNQRGPFRVNRVRPGRYSIADEAGRPMGTIFGDHVIGYTVRTGDRTWRFRDLDAVRQALELDMHMEAEAQAWGRAADRDTSGAA
jgi:hypothetical protein